MSVLTSTPPHAPCVLCAALQAEDILAEHRTHGHALDERTSLNFFSAFSFFSPGFRSGCHLLRPHKLEIVSCCFEEHLLPSATRMKHLYSDTARPMEHSQGCLPVGLLDEAVVCVWRYPQYIIELCLTHCPGAQGQQDSHQNAGQHDAPLPAVHCDRTFDLEGSEHTNCFVMVSN